MNPLRFSPRSAFRVPRSAFETFRVPRSALRVRKLPRWSVVALLLACAPALAVPPVIDTFSPDTHIHNSVPQPDFTITGSNFLVGFPSATNRPTVTLTHESGTPQFSSLVDNINFGGTNLTISAANNNFNLLQAPVGEYTLTVTRPDGEFGTLPGAFIIQTEEQAAGDGIYIKHVGTWGGPVHDIDVVGNLAYIANGRALRILDISDPASPVHLGMIDLEGVAGVRVRDNYAFVSARRPYGFCVVDVADPAAPKLVWHEKNSSSFGSSVYIRGNYAYRGSGAFDITDPHNVIRHSGSVVSQADMVHIHGDRLYSGTNRSSTGQPSELRIYDLAANPLNPPLLGSVSSPDGRYPTGIAVEGDLVAWKVNNRNLDQSGPKFSFFVVDASVPASPNIVATFSDFSEWQSDHEEFNRDVAIRNGFVYVADLGNRVFSDPGQGVMIFDVSNPASPQHVANHKTHAHVFGLRLIDDRAYLFDEGEGLIILDVSTPAAPVRLGKYHSPSTLRKIARNGDLLYVADAWQGFTILDMSDPTRPEVVGEYQSEHWISYQGTLRQEPFGIVYQHNLICLAAGPLGLEVVDVTDSEDPTFLNAFRIPIDPACSWFRGVELSGNVVHVGYRQGPPECSTGGDIKWFIDFDVGNPVDISVVGQLVHSGHMELKSMIISSGGIAFAGGGHAKATIDTSDPFGPWELHPWTGTGWPDVIPAIDVALTGDILFVANNNPAGSPLYHERGLYVQDVTDPANPQLLAVLNAGYTLAEGTFLQSASAVAVQNGRLYVSGQRDGGTEVIHAFDIADPAAPQLLARSRTPSGSDDGTPPNSTCLIVSEPYVFATYSGPNAQWTAMPEGLAIFEVRNLPPTPGDLDGDYDLDLADSALWLDCLAGPDVDDPPPGCPSPQFDLADLDADGDVDLADFAVHQEMLAAAAPERAGACCFFEGVCTIRTPDACTGAGGTYQGNGTDCSDVECPDIPLPTGACCLPDGECVVATDIECDNSGGAYQGDDIECSQVECPSGRYSNTIDPMTQVALAGPGLTIADDMTLEGEGARDLVELDLRVYGNGGGPFSVFLQLWTDCPGSGGSPIAGATFIWSNVPDDGFVYELVGDASASPVTIPDTVWMAAEFSTPQAGWIIAGQAEVGFTENRYGRDVPPWACNQTFGGFPPTYAGLWAHLTCEVGGLRSASPTGPAIEPQTRMLRVDNESISGLQPVPAE